MRPNPFTTALAILITITLVAPSAFFFAPQHVNAIFGVGDVGTAFEINPALTGSAPITATQGTLSAIQNTITAIATPLSAVANTAAQINTYVLQPLAFALSGRLMKALTSSVIKFTIGEANGSGVPQFVTDTKAMLQSVGDSQALAYIKQFNINSNSPFRSAISSSLRSNYLENTTLAGAWAANMDTLERASKDKYRFLNGDWSQGGAGAWMALTTQNQNNPYSLYITMQSKLGSLVVDAQTVRTNEVAQGQGFLSWCGGSDTKLGAFTTLDTPLRAAEFAVSEADANYNAAYDAYEADKTNDYLKIALDAAQSAYDEAEAKLESLTSVSNKSSGISPGDPCINEDGTPGTTKTPGSVIAASLNKVLGGTQDTLTQMGSMAKEVNGIFKNIGTVMQTVKFASDILGGDYNKGGIYGVNAKSGTNTTSALNDYNGSDYFGVTDTMVRAGNATIFSPTNDDMPARIAKYQSAWNTINNAAIAASASVIDLANYCTAQGELAKKSNNNIVPIKLVAQAKAAQTALKEDVAPVLAQFTAVNTAVDAANAMMKKIEAESPEAALLHGPTADTPSYTDDVIKLQTMIPTFDDVGNAQQQAKSLASAVAEPDGSLTVSADSLLDKMNLITKNAKSLKSLCDARFALVAPPAVAEARSRIAQYKLAWDIISVAASSAETNVIALENYCTTQKVLAQKQAETKSEKYNSLVKFISTSDTKAKAARTAFKDIVAPALIEVATASTNVVNASARVDIIEKELLVADAAKYDALMRELQTMQPNDEDVVNAQGDARDTNGAEAESKFSLVISKGSLFDRLALIRYQTRSGSPDLADGIWPWEACDMEGNINPPLTGGISS